MEQIEMYQTGIILTMSCNLKCRLCSNYAPYYSHPEYYSIESLKEMMQRYFKVVPYIRKLMVSGGEPLLHPALADLIEDLKRYREQIGTFGIITNGTIVPSEKLLMAVEEFGCHFHFLIDNYGQNLSVKTEEIDTLLTARGIDHIVRNYTEDHPHCGGFVDFGDLSARKAWTEEEVRQRFAVCAYPQKYHFAFDLVGGVMYPCGPCRRCKELGIADDYSEYIDLFDDSLSLEEQRKKIAAIYKKKSLKACAFCNGMCEDSQRFSPAQQLSPEELVRVCSGARFYADVRS